MLEKYSLEYRKANESETSSVACLMKTDRWIVNVKRVVMHDKLAHVTHLICPIAMQCSGRVELVVSNIGAKRGCERAIVERTIKSSSSTFG